MGKYGWIPRPRVALGVTGVVATGALVYSTTYRAKAPSMPVAEIKRDGTGRIVPPSFPAIKSRAEQLAELRRNGSAGSQAQYDLIVIGGGATGTGIALDAVTRGLKVALVEREDFSAGTSSKSTKLVHGGVRYLEKAILNLDYSQLELVMEALHERKTFLNIAPHLSNSLPILLPLQHWWQAPYMFIGTKMYDILAGSQRLEGSYVMGKSKTLEACPLLRSDKLVGSLVYYDGQQNDARMNVSLALTAALYGATVVNHAEVTSLEKDEQGKICGVKVRDTLAASGTGAASEFTVRAKGVINATGPFTDAVEQMDDAARKPIVAPASGVHIMLPGSLCPNGMGMLDAATSDGRVIFVLPWQGFTLAGTTDTACPVEQDPIPGQNDIDFILKETNKLLEPEAALTRSDVLAAWSGIRPLVRDPKAKNTESLVRNHLVTVSSSGLLTCAGGKWTTYRQMAEDAVDEAIKTFRLKPIVSSVVLPDISGAGLPGFSTNGTCRTRGIRVAGAHGFTPALPSQLMEVYKIDADIAKHMAANYGDRAWAVLAADSAASTKRLLPSMPFTEAEVRYGVRSESACTTVDVIARRMRLAFLDVNSALKALPRVIDVMADELGWDGARKSQEWTKSVHYLESMGLAHEKLGITRDEVLKIADVKAPEISKPSPPAFISPGGQSLPGAAIPVASVLMSKTTSS